MNTLIITLAAVVGQAGEEIQTPLWQRDYAQAKQRAAQEMKPMVVFLAPAENVVNRLLPGGLSDQAKQFMTDKFICVVVDTSTPKGQQLAQAFDLRGGQGMVISDRGGAYQAFWQPGMLNSQDLMRNLQRFADVTSVQSTMIAGRPSFYQGQGVYQAGGFQGDYQQIQPVQQTGYDGRYVDGRYFDGRGYYNDSNRGGRRGLFRNRGYR